MLITNSADGGTDTTTVTTGNSGGASGNAWDTVSIGSGAGLVYSSAQTAHGSLSYLLTTGTSVADYVLWQSQITSPGKTMYARCYCYFSGTSPNNSFLIQFRDASNAIVGGVGISLNKFIVMDSASIGRGIGATFIPLGSWLRLEMTVFSSATIGQVEAKFFATADSTTATETITSAATINTLGTDIARASFGLVGGSASTTIYMDDLAVQDTGYIGPVLNGAGLAWLGT